jgi:hypothetical protein
VDRARESSGSPEQPETRAAAPAPSAGALSAAVVGVARIDTGARTAFVRELQRRVGNRAATRHIARLTLKEKVEHARKTDPKGYVLKAVEGMKSGYTFEERAAEITWRMIWMFVPEKTNSTLVAARSSARGIELAKDPPKKDTELVVAPDFIDGITADNLDDRVLLLRLVFMGKDALKKKLKTDFGFAEVIDGTATWTAGELAETAVGLLKMPADDRKALAGVTLKRDETVMEAGESFTGLFSWRVSAVTTATTTAPTLTQELTMATSAFQSPGAAAWTAVHEAGHAVDSARRRPAALATGTAMAAFNATIAPLNAASTTATNAFNAAIALFSRYNTADRTAARPYTEALRAAHRAIRTLGSAQTSRQLSANETAADAAVAARDRARSALAAGHPARGDFAATVTAQDAWLVAAKARAVARAALLKAQSDEAAVTSQTGTMSRRLERFVAVVNRNGIAPITPYARKNWPGHPDEFFAEAYAMWLNDPKRLDSLAKPLKDWFDAGEHLK